MSDEIRFHRNIPVAYDVDVCIAGGGPAGIAAAVSAARNGADVFLGESAGCFGGLGTSGLVPAFCGVGNGKNFLGGYICREVFDAMKIPSGELGREFSYIDVERLKSVYDSMIAASGIKFTLETRMVAVETEDGIVRSVVFSDDGDSGLFAVKAKVFIDATGNGDLAAWAGADYTQGNAAGIPMPSTLCSLWSNVNWEKFNREKPDVFQLLLKAIDDGIFEVPDRHHSGMFPVGSDRAGGNFTHAFGVRGNDREQKTAAWLELRRKLGEYQLFYNRYVPGFEQAHLCMSAPMMGIRECRRISGDYVLTLDDFRKRSRFDDEIGEFAYPVDIHPLDPSVAEFERFTRDFYGNLRYGAGESYGIPYRVLVPKKLKNVLTAGRCVSTDQPMAASIRVMPGCFLTGQAAGTAAALASAGCGGLVRDISIAELRKKINYGKERF